MNTVLSVLIICGFLYLSFVTWMFRRKEGMQRPPERRGEAKPDTSSSQPLATLDSPQKRLRHGHFPEISLAATLTSAVRQALGAATGDAGPAGNYGGYGDVESDDEDPDMDDVDPGRVSPPTTGDSIEEIEDALSVAVNPGADADSKPGRQRAVRDAGRGFHRQAYGGRPPHQRRGDGVHSREYPHEEREARQEEKSVPPPKPRQSPWI